MNARRDRGSAAEMVPVLLIGILLVVGALQTALFMSGRHAAELAAFRASRELEEHPSMPAHAKAEAEKFCRLGYPESLESVSVHTKPPAPVVLVRLRMNPLLPVTLMPEGWPFRALTIQARHPPQLKGGGR